MTGDGGLVEVQATAERTPLSRAHLDDLLALAQHGIEELREIQAAAVTVSAVRLLLATRNAHKLREFERLLPAVALDPLPDERRHAARGRRHLRRQRADQGPRGGRRHRPRRDRRRLRHRGGGARLARPASAPPASPASTRPTARTSPSSPPRRRPAAALRYVCVIAHVDADGAEHLFEGTADGHGRATRRAASGGFGYDPLFVPDDGGDGRTMAELTDAEKDAISHRGRAARALEEWLERDDARPAHRARRSVSIVSNAALIVLKLVAGVITGSVAIITEAIHSAVDLVGLLHRLLLRPPGRDAGRRRAPLRPREVRERRGRRRGRADPRSARA